MYLHVMGVIKFYFIDLSTTVNNTISYAARHFYQGCFRQKKITTAKATRTTDNNNSNNNYNNNNNKIYINNNNNNKNNNDNDNDNKQQ